MEIQIDTTFIKARFEIQSNSSKNQGPTFDVELPRNLFVSLFTREPLNRKVFAESSLGKLGYRITLNDPIEPKLILDALNEYLEIIESENFLSSYLLKTFRIKMKSGVNIYYLLSKATVSSSKNLLLTFDMISLRRLSSYIMWRILHCGGTPENVSYSLKNHRKEVITKFGESTVIDAINWPVEKKIPSFIVCKRVERFLPSDLFHNAKHFLISEQLTRKAWDGLERISFHFVEGLTRFFFQRKSWNGEFRKLKCGDETFTEYKGRQIRVHASFLQIVGKNQNNWLLKKLSSFFRSSTERTTSNGTRNLLLISCSATKEVMGNLLPAILRYCGRVHLMVKAILQAKSWPKNTDMLIISAKYGVLSPLDPIPYYERRLLPENVSTLSNLVKRQQREIFLPPYETCFVYLSPLYSMAASSIIDELSTLGCRIILGASLSQLIEWVTRTDTIEKL